VTAGDLVAAARGLLRRPDPATAGLWPRAAALLARQALEAALGELWRRKRLELADCPMRVQLLCLRDYLADRGAARGAAHAWAALSRACHQRPYELAPTAGELAGWLEAVETVVAATMPGGAADATTPRG
jgi:hypothetical protein